MSVHRDWQWDCKVTDNSLAALFTSAVLNPPVQTCYLSHLVCKPNGSAMVINWYHCCMGTASLYVIIRVTCLHVQKQVEACLALAVNNMISWLLISEPWPFTLLGSSVTSQMLISWIWKELGSKGGICIHCVSAVIEVLLCERASTLEGLEQGHPRFDLTSTCYRKLNDLALPAIERFY